MRIIKSSCDLVDVAYHEAGHVVIAHKLNLGIPYANVVWDAGRNRWAGGTKATPRLDDSDLETQLPVLAASKAKASVAGMLAQAKFKAGRQIGSDLATFNVAMKDFGDLWSLLRINEKPRTAPGIIRLEFADPGKTVHPLVFEANECFISVEDMDNFDCYVTGRHLARIPVETDEQLVIETMELLDREECWNSVHVLARALINDGLGRCLVENELLPFLLLDAEKQPGLARM